MIETVTKKIALFKYTDCYDLIAISECREGNRRRDMVRLTEPREVTLTMLPRDQRVREELRSLDAMKRQIDDKYFEEMGKVEEKRRQLLALPNSDSPAETEQ